MQFQSPFDARQVEPSVGFELIPIGDYKVVITGSEPKMVGDGQSQGALLFTFQIIEGQYAGKTFTQLLNLFNSNPQAAEIARKELSAICHVTGVFNVSHSEQLHNIPFWVSLGLSKDGKYNDIKTFRNLQGQVPGKANGSVAAAPAAPAPAPAAPAPAAWAAPGTGPTGAPPWASGAPAAPVQPPANTWQPPPAAAPPQAAPVGWQPPAASAQPSAAPPWAAQPAAPAAAPSWPPK